MRKRTGCRTRSGRFILNNDIVIVYDNYGLPVTIQLSTSLALILLPLVLIELGLVLFSLVDLFRPERRVVGNSKVVWALVIVLVGTIGPIVYLLAGRKQT